MLAYTQAHLLWLEWTYLKRGWPLIGLFSFSALRERRTGIFGR